MLNRVENSLQVLDLQSDTERRSHERIPAHQSAFLESSDLLKSSILIRNISSGGFLISSKMPLRTGSIAELSIVEGGKTRVRSTGTVLRSIRNSQREFDVAIACASPLSLISLVESKAIQVRSRKLLKLTLPPPAAASLSVEFKGVFLQEGSVDLAGQSDKAHSLLREADVLVFPSCVAPLPKNWKFSRNGFRYVSAWPRFLVDLRSSFEEYVSKFSSKSRATLRRKTKKLASAGDITFNEYRSPSEIAQFFALANAVAVGAYQKNILRASIAQGGAFYEKMIGLAREDRTRGYVLHLQDEPIAFIYCWAIGDRLIHECSGYDPRFRDCSPGVLLQNFCFEKLFGNDRFSFFDFESGGGQHKEFFATTYVECADVYFFKLSIRNLIKVGFYAGMSQGMRVARKWVQTLGHEPEIRRIIRQVRPGRKNLAVLIPVSWMVSNCYAHEVLNKFCSF